MSRFSAHFQMKEQDAIDYTKEKLDFFPKNANLTCKEIGDGNINYIFRVEDEDTENSIIIKHADVATRSSNSKISIDRNRIETEVLQLEGKLAPGHVPEVYFYDPVMACVVMEDLKEYKNLRFELIQHHQYPTLAEDISTFMANTLIKTTDVVLTPKEKKDNVAEFINPDMCDITERLVYTFPYTASPDNILFAPNERFLKEELYEDQELHLEVAKLKESFKNKAQALLHGDLHSGSLFVKEGSTKALDPEFAFYGPIGYDVGNVIANLIFAWANGVVTMEAGAEQKDYLTWLETTIAEVLDLFLAKSKVILEQEATEAFAKTPGFLDWYLADILEDTAGVVGLELNRRIVGSAKVADIAKIADSEQRKLAERICVLSAKEVIKGRKGNFRTGGDYVALIQKNKEKALGLPA